MARTSAEMPPEPAPAQKEANRRASSRRRAPFSAVKDRLSQWKYSTTTPNSATNAPPTE